MLRAGTTHPRRSKNPARTRHSSCGPSGRLRACKGTRFRLGPTSRIRFRRPRHSRSCRSSSLHPQTRTTSLLPRILLALLSTCARRRLPPANERGRARPRSARSNSASPRPALDRRPRSSRSGMALLWVSRVMTDPSLSRRGRAKTRLTRPRPSRLSRPRAPCSPDLDRTRDSHRIRTRDTTNGSTGARSGQLRPS